MKRGIKMGKTKKKGKLLSFDFWQKFGKALLVVIAVMPAAGLMITIGKLLGMYFEADIIQAVSRVMDNIGWGIIGNLHILFAVAIGGSWAKERAGGAFAGLLSFVLINRITGAIFGVSLFGASYQPALLFILPPGAFLTLGILMAIFNKVTKKSA